MKKTEEKMFLQSQELKAAKKNFRHRGWRQWRDNFGHFLTRQRLVSSELVMIGNARQRLSRFGVERGKMEVPVWYEREREREMRFAILENGKWKSGGIVKFGIFGTGYVWQRSSDNHARQWV